jgi:hypothetical protein
MDVDQTRDENTTMLGGQPPQTPQFDGLRTMFGKPQEPGGLKTPAFDGVRDLYREPQDPSMPRLDGVRQLFSEKQVPPTPAFHGTSEMMLVDQNPGSESNSDRGRSAQLKSVLEDIEVDEEQEMATPKASSSRKPPSTSRTLTRSKGSQGELVRTHGTPTDLSTMADDEATPDSNPIVLPKRL